MRAMPTRARPTEATPTAPMVWGKPKSKAGERVVGLDRGSVAAVTAHRTLRKREGLAAWIDFG